MFHESLTEILNCLGKDDRTASIFWRKTTINDYYVRLPVVIRYRSQSPYHSSKHFFSKFSYRTKLAYLSEHISMWLCVSTCLCRMAREGEADGQRDAQEAKDPQEGQGAARGASSTAPGTTWLLRTSYYFATPHQVLASQHQVLGSTTPCTWLHKTRYLAPLIQNLSIA